MHDSQEHILTDEFDDLCIAISLNMGTAAGASAQVTIWDHNRVWDELMLISADSHSHKDTGLCAFEGDL